MKNTVKKLSALMLLPASLLSFASCAGIHADIYVGPSYSETVPADAAPVTVPETDAPAEVTEGSLPTAADADAKPGMPTVIIPGMSGTDFDFLKDYLPTEEEKEAIRKKAEEMMSYMSAFEAYVRGESDEAPEEYSESWNKARELYNAGKEAAEARKDEISAEIEKLMNDGRKLADDIKSFLDENREITDEIARLFNELAEKAKEKFSEYDFGSFDREAAEKRAGEIAEKIAELLGSLPCVSAEITQ
ncbi:MAG: hypothetical protein MJ137_05415 [Clostridia bacterium]|nr:hypothetical protein [Clostridia bacterium]